MTGSGDRLQDVRQRPTFHLEAAAISYIPRVGPAAWAVYCYLLARVAEGDPRWPDDLTIATACGISTYNARRSIEQLIEEGLIARHQWTRERGGPTTFAVMPVYELGQPPEGAATLRQPRGTDRLVAEDPAEEERWRQESEERNETRELFSRLLEALGVDPAQLSDADRSSVTQASRLARAAGATPDDVENMIERLRQAQPDLVLDAERMLDYWSRLFRSDEDEDSEPSN